jgi:VWFA-related protein
MRLLGTSSMRRLMNLRLMLLFGLFLSQADAQTTARVFRAESTVVLVPTLVARMSGEIVYGLTAKDFIVEEEGVEQAITLDESPGSERISLVVAVQLGGSAYLNFEARQEWLPGSGDSIPQELRHRKAALSGLGTMVGNFIGEAKGEVAIVAFDSHVELLQNFSGDLPAVSEKLNRLQGSRDGGAAILDAISFSLDLLADRPPGQLRILLLISETRDHGSKTAKLDGVLKQVAASNTLVYSVAFHPLRIELARDLKGQNPAPVQAAPPPGLPPQAASPGPNLLGPLLTLAMNSMAKNTARPLANLTGGEYRTFSNKRTFDANLSLLANHVRNRYLISFQPKNPRPGAHVISVRLRNSPRDVVVLARNSYWVTVHAPLP